MKEKESKMRELNRKLMFTEDKIDLVQKEKDSFKDHCDKQSTNLRRQYSMII